GAARRRDLPVDQRPGGRRAGAGAGDAADLRRVPPDAREGDAIAGVDPGAVAVERPAGAADRDRPAAPRTPVRRRDRPGRPGPKLQAQVPAGRRRADGMGPGASPPPGPDPSPAAEGSGARPPDLAGLQSQAEAAGRATVAEAFRRLALLAEVGECLASGPPEADDDLANFC